MKIAQINIRSLNSNKEIFKKVIEDYNLDIICAQETWLNTDKYNFSSESNIECKNRNDGYGGTAIIINKKIKYSRLKIPNIVPIEAIAINVQINKIYCNLFSLYIPPQIKNRDLEEKLNILNTFLQNKENIIRCADINSTHELWDSSNTSNRKSEIIVNFLQESNLMVCNTGEYTHLHYNGVSAIDVTFVSPSLYDNFQWSVTDETCGSDHRLIINEWKTNVVRELVKPRINKKLLITAINNCERIEETTSMKGFLQEMDWHINNNTYFNGNRNSKNWWSNEINIQYEKKKEQLKTFNKNMTYDNYIKIKKETAKLKLLITQAKKKKWENFCEDNTIN